MSCSFPFASSLLGCQLLQLVTWWFPRKRLGSALAAAVPAAHMGRGDSSVPLMKVQDNAFRKRIQHLCLVWHLGEAVVSNSVFFSCSCLQSHHPCHCSPGNMFFSWVVTGPRLCTAPTVQGVRAYPGLPHPQLRSAPFTSCQEGQCLWSLLF